jgi:transposase
MVDLGWAGRSPEDLAREFEPTGQSIRNWIKQADLEDGRRTDGLTVDEEELVPSGCSQPGQGSS